MNPYPSRADLEREANAEHVIADHLDATSQLRAILNTAIAAVRGLDMPLDWPAQGYDKPSTIETLRDMLPIEYAADREAMLALSADAHEREFCA